MTRGASHYAVLGVQPSASLDVIKAAYRRLAKQLHPDSTGGDASKAEQFRQVAQAWSVLGDAKQRAAYDEGLRQSSFLGRGLTELSEDFTRGATTLLAEEARRKVASGLDGTGSIGQRLRKLATVAIEEVHAEAQSGLSGLFTKVRGKL